VLDASIAKDAARDHTLLVNLICKIQKIKVHNEKPQSFCDGFLLSAVAGVFPDPPSVSLGQQND
jgi:hypothetical protein